MFAFSVCLVTVVIFVTGALSMHPNWLDLKDVVNMELETHDDVVNMELETHDDVVNMKLEIHEVVESMEVVEIMELETNGVCDFSDPIYAHLRDMEGFRLVGYIPTALSGVTIATGIDLGQQTEGRLITLGVPGDVILLCKPYLGLKTAAEVKAHHLKAEDLKLTQNQACLLDKPFVVEEKRMTRAFSLRMTTRGKACLVSLRHWAGHLGNKKYDGKLAVRVDGKIVNFVWNAIEFFRATDVSLASALSKTLVYQKVGTAAYNRIKREIDYLHA